MLSLEAIFKDHDYDPKEPGQIHWLEEGDGTQLHLHTLMTDYFEDNLKNQQSE